MSGTLPRDPEISRLRSAAINYIAARVAVNRALRLVTRFRATMPHWMSRAADLIPFLAFGNADPAPLLSIGLEPHP